MMRRLYCARRSTCPHDGFSSVPTESGASQRVVKPANSNASAAGTRSGRLRPDARKVRLATVPEFHVNVPPSWRPNGNV